MTENIYETMRSIAKQIGTVVALPPDNVFCPYCGEGDEKGYWQPLSSFGDREWILFCPHCNYEWNIIIVPRS